MHTPNDIILKRPIRCKVNTYSETYVSLGRASLVIKSQGVLRTIRGQYDTAAGLSIPSRMQLLRQRLERGIKDPKRAFKHNISALGQNGEETCKQL